MWVDQGTEFYNSWFGKWLKDNDIGMYSTHSEGKSVKIYKHMAVVSKNVYFDVLDDIVEKYNNTYHNTIKMKPIDVKSDSFAEYNEEPNEKDPKFKVGDHVRISKYKNIFVKGYTPNWSEEIFVVKKIKNTVLQTYVINDINCGEIIETFHEKELQKNNQTEFRIAKVIKRKGNKLYVEWKVYNNSFNCRIDKKDLIK